MSSRFPAVNVEWSYASQVFTPSSPGSSSHVGRRIGPFAVEAELGRGGMGQVFRVRYGEQRFALKLLLSETGNANVRLEREAKLVGALEHPGIVKLRGAGRVGGKPFLLYELIQGAQPLSKGWAGLSLERRLELIAQIADAVGYAHAQGIVHRDLKPDNVLLDEVGVPRVIDFGLATHDQLGGLTRTGACVGTPAYMAPEQFSVERPNQRPQIDVWALGVLLYEALTDRPPFEADTMYELASLVERGVFTRPSKLNPAVSPAVEAVCLRALQSKQGRRHPDADSFARQLRSALTEAPSTRAGYSALWVVGALLACAVVAGGLTLRDHDPTPPRAEKATPPTNHAPAVELARPFKQLQEGEVSGDDLLQRARARLAVDPHDVVARSAEATALLELADYEAAAALAAEVLRDAPHQPDALRTQIGALYRLQRYSEARAVGRRWLAADPESLNALVYMSLIASDERDLDAALAYVSRALELDPTFAPALAARGMALLAQGHAAQALDDFDSALEQEDVSNTHFNRSAALFRLGRHQEALEALDHAKEQSTGPPWKLMRLRCLTAIDLERAEDYGRELARSNPERADVAFLLGEVLRRRLDPECRTWFEQALRLAPDEEWGQAAQRRLRSLEADR